MSADPMSTSSSKASDDVGGGGDEDKDTSLKPPVGGGGGGGYASGGSSKSGKSAKSSPEVTAARQVVEDAKHDKEAAQAEVDDLMAKIDAAKARVEEADLRYLASLDALEEAELTEPCQWNSMYAKLVEYKEANGDCLVPHSTPGDKELTSLGRWVANQRVFYKMHNDGKLGHIKPVRIRTLTKLGFVWNVNDMLWERRFQELTAYKEKHGTCDIPTKCDKDVVKLRKWVDLQRQHYRLFRAKRTTSLTPDRIKKLDELGLGWRVGGDYEKTTSSKNKKRRNTIDPSEDELTVWWNSNFEELRAYREEHGHCRMHQRVKSSQARGRQGSSRLRDFASWQRKEHKKRMDGEPNEMTDERLRKLEELGFEFVTNPRRGTPGKKGVKGEENDDGGDDGDNNGNKDQHGEEGEGGGSKTTGEESKEEDKDVTVVDGDAIATKDLSSPQGTEIQMV